MLIKVKPKNCRFKRFDFCCSSKLFTPRNIPLIVEKGKFQLPKKSSKLFYVQHYTNGQCTGNKEYCKEFQFPNLTCLSQFSLKFQTYKQSCPTKIFAHVIDRTMVDTESRIPISLI